MASLWGKKFEGGEQVQLEKTKTKQTINDPKTKKKKKRAELRLGPRQLTVAQTRFNWQNQFMQTVAIRQVQRDLCI